MIFAVFDPETFVILSDMQLNYSAPRKLGSIVATHHGNVIDSI